MIDNTQNFTKDDEELMGKYCSRCDEFEFNHTKKDCDENLEAMNKFSNMKNILIEKVPKNVNSMLKLAFWIIKNTILLKKFHVRIDEDISFKDGT